MLFLSIIRKGQYYYPHFTDGKTEARNVFKVTKPVRCRIKLKDIGLLTLNLIFLPIYHVGFGGRTELPLNFGSALYSLACDFGLVMKSHYNSIFLICKKQIIGCYESKIRLNASSMTLAYSSINNSFCYQHCYL